MSGNPDKISAVVTDPHLSALSQKLVIIKRLSSLPRRSSLAKFYAMPMLGRFLMKR
jgi:hypothetical protein